MTQTRPEDRSDVRQAHKIWEMLRTSMPCVGFWPTIPIDEEGPIDCIVNNAPIMVDKVRESMGLYISH